MAIGYDIGRAERPWEAKGRGIAVFRCSVAEPLGSIEGLPGTAVCTPEEPLPKLPAGITRVVLKGYHERFFFETCALNDLINRVVLPAYRERVPLYLFAECPQTLFVVGELPFGDQEALAHSLRELAREQMGALLAQMCLLMPSPDALAVGDSTPMTPIERMLARAMDKLGLNYTAQMPIGPYYADFALESPEGHLLCVEADGREYHEHDSDAARDRDLTERYGVTQVLRFTGSKIWHGPDACAEHVRVLWQRLTAIPVQAASNLSLTAPAPVPQARPEVSPEQSKALAPLRGVVLTLAPAGSGKTRVLARRVVEAVRAGIPPERVLCVVYNVGAREVMENRIHGEHNLPTVAVRTLHSLGYEVVLNAPGTRYSGYRIADGDALPGGLQKLYKQAIRADYAEQAQLRDDAHTRPKYVSDELADAYAEYVSIFKKTLVKLGQAMDIEALPEFDVAQAARVAAKVEEELARRRLMTFDDQIYRGVEVLLASPKARIRYQQQYDVVLVDEFQDLTPVQFLFVRLLALPFNNLFAVGDDDQMINSYAGADPRNLRDFTELFNGAVVHTLGENHRCAPTIVRRSANLISYNQDRFQKDIRPATRDGREKPECADSFVVRVAPNPAGEAQDIVEAIQRWRADGIAYGDTAVLVRVKNVAPLVQIALKRAGVPFVPLEKAAFFTSRVGRLVGAYMNLCRCPAVVAPEHLELALGTPPRFIAHETLVRMCADGWGCLAGHRLTPSNAQSGLKQFVANAQRVFDYSADGAKSSSEVLALVMRAFGLDEHFRKEDRNNSNTGVSGSGEMLALIRQLAAEHPRFEEFVDWYNEQSKREVEASRPGARSPKEDAVRILTIHSCKGAEFRAVALFHMSEGVAPHAKALATGMLAPIEEERRVFYVGVTRGIDRLLVTSDRSRPSRFLEELERPRPMPQPVSTAFQTGGSKPAGSTESATSAPDATDAKPQTLLGAVWRFLCDLFGGN